LADIERYDQGIAGFLDNVLIQNYSQFREDMRIRSGNAVRIVERDTSQGQATLLDSSQFLDDPGHTLFVCPHHDTVIP
jgi:hypothetical protein